MQLTCKNELGRGGFGIVELVEDENGHCFARKRFSVNQPLPDELIPNVRKRFVREANLQSGIKHRNIVPIVHKDLTSATPWYLMPVAESSLADDIEVDKRLNGSFLLAISDIISGLEELHSMQMFHRDLKPQNVLRFHDPEADRSIYSISDFGFISLNDSKLSKLTYTGMKKGTDYFTAPEMTKDLKHASAQADIYSLGCIIHEMVGLEDRVPCAEIKEQGDFGGVMINCTRLRPERRFKSAAIVRDALLSVNEGQTPSANLEVVSIVEILDGDAILKKEGLARIVELVEDDEGGDDAEIVLRKLSMERIQQGWEVNNDAIKRIGFAFAEWISSNTFAFEYCDVLANRAEAFIARGEIDLQAECLMALLSLGTQHNRWYVETIFNEACGPAMDEGLAKRVAVEFRARADEGCAMIEHLEGSISASRENFHPILASVLKEVCL